MFRDLIPVCGLPYPVYCPFRSSAIIFSTSSFPRGQLGWLIRQAAMLLLQLQGQGSMFSRKRTRFLWAAEREIKSTPETSVASEGTKSGAFRGHPGGTGRSGAGANFIIA